jgi:hypothetical protein
MKNTSFPRGRQARSRTSAKRRRMSEADVARVVAIRRRHLLKLARMRRGAKDGEHGRNMLKALLACGMTGPDAQKWAPWLPPKKLQSVIAEVDSVPSSYWTADRLGDLVELTDAERESGKLWSLRPCDVQWSHVQDRVYERKKARDRASQCRKRARNKEALKMAKDLDVREETLFVAVCSKGKAWTSAMALTSKIEHARSFHAPDGWPIAGASLRTIVHRNLDRLAEQGLIESKTERGRHGFPTRFSCAGTTWRRRIFSPVTR